MPGLYDEQLCITALYHNCSRILKLQNMQTQWTIQQAKLHFILLKTLLQYYWWHGKVIQSTMSVLTVLTSAQRSTFLLDFVKLYHFFLSLCLFHPTSALDFILCLFNDIFCIVNMKVSTFFYFILPTFFTSYFVIKKSI